MIERRTDDRLVMVKNTNYWNKDNIVPEKLVFILMQNGTAAVAGIKGICISEIILRFRILRI